MEVGWRVDRSLGAHIRKGGRSRACGLVVDGGRLEDVYFPTAEEATGTEAAIQAENMEGQGEPSYCQG